jgi:ABC-type transport system substrate-binding protein
MPSGKNKEESIMKSKIMWVAMVVLMVGSALLAACSGGGTTTTAPTTTAAKPTTTAAVPTTTAAKPTTTAAVPTTTAVKPTAAPGTQKRGGILKVITGAPTNIGIPWEANSPPDLWYANPAIETLLKTNDKGQPIPWLATAWTVAPDNKSITFTLRKGVKFHDGTDFNAAALKSSETHPSRTGTQAIAGGRIHDYTAKVNLSVPMPQIFSYFAVLRPGWMISNCS